MIGFIITSLVLAISLIIISKLPTGVEIDDFSKAIIAGLVLGFFNAIAAPILSFFSIFNVLTLGLFSLVVNVIIFGLAAKLIEGFRLKWGIMSAVIGVIALSLVNSILSSILSSIGLLPTAS